MLKAKYKMHRLVNLAFYFLVFLAGFLLGGGKFEKVFDMFKYIT